MGIKETLERRTAMLRDWRRLAEAPEDNAAFKEFAILQALTDVELNRAAPQEAQPGPVACEPLTIEREGMRKAYQRVAQEAFEGAGQLEMLDKTELAACMREFAVWAQEQRDEAAPQEAQPAPTAPAKGRPADVEAIEREGMRKAFAEAAGRAGKQADSCGRNAEFLAQTECSEIKVWALGRADDCATAAPQEVQPAPTAIPIPMRAGSVIGCPKCAKPAALVGDRFDAGSLCMWCEEDRRPGAVAIWMRDEARRVGREPAPTAPAKGSTCHGASVDSGNCVGNMGKPCEATAPAKTATPAQSELEEAERGLRAELDAERMEQLGARNVLATYRPDKKDCALHDLAFIVAGGLEAALEAAKAELAEAKRLRNVDSFKVDGMATEHRRMAEELGEARRQLAMVRVTDAEGVWYWQSDGGNDLDSLVCPVVMSAETLRGILAEAMEASQPAPQEGTPLVMSAEARAGNVTVCTYTYPDRGMEMRSLWHMQCRDEAQATAIADVLNLARMPADRGPTT